MAERAAATVAGTIVAKARLGWGMSKPKKKTGKKTKSKKSGGVLTFCKVSEKIRKSVRRANSEDAVKKAVQVSDRMKKASTSISHPKVCVIPIPKTGGILPLIPIFVGYS